MTRRITVVNPQTNSPVVIETDATTWGELKNLIHRKSIFTDGMKGMIRQTKNELTRDDSVLPTGDFDLFLFVNKVKSGLDIDSLESSLRRKLDDVVEEILDEIEEGLHDGKAKSSDCDVCDEYEELKEEMEG